MNRDYQRVAAAIEFLERNACSQPTLAEAAQAACLSPFHFQRLFLRWAGVTPKRFLQFLTVEHAKRLLEGSADVLSVADTVGLSGGGRLHDHFLAVEAVTPGEFKRAGEGLELRWGVGDSPFGEAVVATTGRGVCWLAFTGADDDPPSALAAAWPGAGLRRDDDHAASVLDRAFGTATRGGLPLHVRGTNFQVRVWQALLDLPPGALASYAGIAAAIGRPGAARAVGAAVARNPVACLIPCHRIVRASGELGGYRWGRVRKRALIAWEAAHAAAAGQGALSPRRGGPEAAAASPAVP